MRPTRNFLSGIILLAFVFALAGCSALRIGYANGDSFVYWWMNGYVNFSDEQKPWVQEEIAKFFAWHRQTQLPDYARVLAKAQQRIQQPVSAAEVHGDFALMRERAERVFEHALPALTTLALSLTPQQIANIERKFASNNDKYRKEYLRSSPDELQQARFDKVMKQAEFWFGSFNAAQREAIRHASDARPLDYQLWLAERQRRQSELIRILNKVQAERPSREATAALLRGYMGGVLENFTYRENRQFFEASREGMAQLTAHIINNATPAQKMHATRRMQKLIEDGHALAGISPAQQLSQAD